MNEPGCVLRHKSNRISAVYQSGDSSPSHRSTSELLATNALILLRPPSTMDEDVPNERLLNLTSLKTRLLYERRQGKAKKMSPVWRAA